jgi:hypothetical protein
LEEKRAGAVSVYEQKGLADFSSFRSNRLIWIGMLKVRCFKDRRRMEPADQSMFLSSRLDVYRF